MTETLDKHREITEEGRGKKGEEKEEEEKEE